MLKNSVKPTQAVQPSSPKWSHFRGEPASALASAHQHWHQLQHQCDSIQFPFLNKNPLRSQLLLFIKSLSSRGPQEISIIWFLKTANSPNF